MIKTVKPLNIFYTFLMLIFLCLSSCATPTHTNISKEQEKDLMNDFKHGKADLPGGLSCAGAYGWQKQSLRLMLDKQEYEKLALSVIRIGWPDNQSWFYLAISAQQLGYIDAAIIYYQKSINCRHTCIHPSGNHCDGLDLPQISIDGLADLQKRVAEEQRTPFGHLARWEGRDPVEDNLWSDPKILESFQRTLGPERTQQLITGWGVGSPAVTAITRVDDNIVFGACKPKDSCYHQVIMFMSLTDGSVEACWQDANGTSVSDVWLSSTGDTHKLPNGYCEQKEDTNLRKMYYQNTR